MATSLPHPKMRGLLATHLKKHFMIGATLAVIGAAGVKFFLYDWRKAKYAEFHRTYDPMKDFERMRELGVFQSVRPLGEAKED